jgi:hypothetical protein
VNLNAGRARPPRVRPATSHRKCGWKIVTANSSSNGNRSSEILRFQGLDGLFKSFWIYVPEAYAVGARLLEHVAGTNPCSNRPSVQLRIRKVPWTAWELPSGNERTDELGPVSNAHKCSSQKRIEKRGKECLIMTYCAVQIFN